MPRTIYTRPGVAAPQLRASLKHYVPGAALAIRRRILKAEAVAASQCGAWVSLDKPGYMEVLNGDVMASCSIASVALAVATCREGLFNYAGCRAKACFRDRIL
jgi:hypothetical protein